MAEADTLNPAFWDERYRTGQMGWDKGRCAPPIQRMLKEGLVEPGSRVAVVGAGRGYEALEAARVGFDVTAFDFAPLAVEALKALAKERGVVVKAAQSDVLTMGTDYPGAFDAIIEHTCFCAIDPKDAARYVDSVADALAPQGHLLGLFFAHGRPGGPPFTTSLEAVGQHFSRRFDAARLGVAPDSFEDRAGQELEFVFRRKA